MKKLNACLLVVFLIFASMLTACGDQTHGGKTSVIFWGFADEEEAATVKEIVNWYNENGTDNIYIDYKPQPSASYADNIDRALAATSKKNPDVFYVNDRYLKRWTKFGYLENIQSMVDESGMTFENVWSSAVWRYRYDPVNNTNNLDDPLYALPKDITPTALYYNESIFEKHGIKVISVDEADLAAFNAGEKDLKGKTKSDYGISDGFTVPAKGFYREQPYKNGRFRMPAYNNGKVVETMIFNNRIAMSWDEIEDLAMIYTKERNTNLVKEDPTWGYFTEWWFNYGWGVGGDCAEDTTGEGDWTFTLGDKTQKKLVYRADGTPLTDEKGSAIFVKASEWDSYALKDGQYLGDVLPTQYEAFERFIKLGKPQSAGGLGIAPRTTADIGLSSYPTFFSTGKVAMMVLPNYNINTMRKIIQDDFTWDVAPLPMYKEYAADGVTVKNKGIEIGHSGSSGLGVWSKSKKKDAAFKVAQYLSAGHAQSISAKNGFLMPNDKTLAKTDYVQYNLEKNLAPKNIELFTLKADNQRPADWWYMPDNAWIDVWATPLNTIYRENASSLDEFFATYTEETNKILRSYKNTEK